MDQRQLLACVRWKSGQDYLMPWSDVFNIRNYRYFSRAAAYLGRRRGVRSSRSPFSDPSSQIYEIEAIVGVGWDFKSRDYYYLIEWLGFDERENTWEPRGNVTDQQSVHHTLQEVGRYLSSRFL